MRTLVVVDGEHYPPVTRWGIATARERGYDVVAAFWAGGIEKLTAGAGLDLGVPVLRPGTGDAANGLRRAIDEVAPDVVLDLSDEPILGYRERMEMASVALWRGVPYHGADFRLEPPPAAPSPPGLPTLAVIGTGKRSGKTAVAGEVARHAARRGSDPVVVAMGRGGPREPQVAEAGSVSLSGLLDLVRAGQHAASDYLEDALTTGVTTIGARRAGGGLAGAPFVSNVAEALALAAARNPGLVVLEGSGAAVPPVAWDAGILVVPASCPPEYLAGYLGSYRLLRTDLAIVTMASSPTSGFENLSTLTSHLRDRLGSAGYVVTDFHPVPLADVAGRDAYLATTAPDGVAAIQAAHLERTARCRVVGWSGRLADRVGLAEDLDAAQGYDVLLTELKAAAVDVACQRALARGAEVVFMDNRADVVDGTADLDALIGDVLDLAASRSRSR